MTCTVCGDAIDPAYPTATTCRQWCDQLARERGDLLSAADADRLMLVRLYCQLDRALQEDAEQIGEW